MSEHQPPPIYKQGDRVLCYISMGDPDICTVVRHCEEAFDEEYVVEDAQRSTWQVHIDDMEPVLACDACGTADGTVVACPNPNGDDGLAACAACRKQ
jgi:hypothetical protein